MFGRIVVPLDESQLAEQALPVAAHIARMSGGSILLVHIVQPMKDYSYYPGSTPLLASEIVTSDYERAETYLKEMARSKVVQGIHVTTEVMSHDVAHGILEVSQKNEADVIVLSSHGYTGVKRWIMGSVAQKIVHHSPVPVLVLRPEASRLPKDQQQPIRVLVPLDGSALAEEILNPAALLSTILSSPSQGELHLACVLPLSEAETIAYRERERVLQHARDYLKSIEQRLKGEPYHFTDLSITTSVTISEEVAHTLVELAEGKYATKQVSDIPACQMIAMATHGRSGVARWAMGSVTDRVLAITNLPTLIMKPHRIREQQIKNQGKVVPEEQNSQAPEEHYLQQELIEPQSWTGLL